MKKLLPVKIAFLMITVSCGSIGSSDVGTPIPVGEFVSEYSQSKETTRQKYFGRAITVIGYAAAPPIMPEGPDDEGVLVIWEEGGNSLLTLSCFFRANQKPEFARLTGPRTVRLMGTFDDSVSTALNPCQLVEIID